MKVYGVDFSGIWGEAWSGFDLRSRRRILVRRCVFCGAAISISDIGFCWLLTPGCFVGGKRNCATLPTWFCCQSLPVCCMQKEVFLWLILDRLKELDEIPNSGDGVSMCNFDFHGFHVWEVLHACLRAFFICLNFLSSHIFYSQSYVCVDRFWLISELVSVVFAWFP